VIVAKALARRPARPSPGPAAPPVPAWRSLLLPAAGLALVVAAAALHLRRTSEPIATSPATTRPAPDRTPRRDALLSPPSVGSATTDTSTEAAEAAFRAARALEADQEAGNRLAARLRARAPLSDHDVRVAEELYGRYPAAARDLLEAVLIAAAAAHRDARRHGAAVALLERARAVAPRSPQGARARLATHVDSGDWPAAEAAARDLLALQPSDAGAAQGLAYALVRQDRSAEAADTLAAFLDAHPDPQARSLLERIQRDRTPEAALDEARLAHFHVRYDGEAHEAVGREILRVLDRHYAALVRTFDHQPAAPIPVILLSRESYYDTTGAPAWSGGRYDSFDGRVRLPIGGLTAALGADLDGALLHELTHAFVAEISGGVAPREVHEGLAQLMEGKRAETLAGEEGLRALASGRVQGVAGFYLSALAFVEELAAQRGQGGLNDLLRAMAETGSVDEAFRRVYGADMGTLRRAWAVSLRQRHGG
jgi:tetratricopeptide (TPR) repeat protein